jgi:hypothetical protein
VTLELHPGKLLAIEEMPLIQDLDIPEAFYLVTHDPALLAGASPDWIAANCLFN